MRLPARLTADEQTWLESYVSRLKRDLGPKLRRVVIFGSTARGDATDESDIDVLVLVEDDSENRDTVLNVQTAAWTAPDTRIGRVVNHSVIGCSEADWKRELDLEMPFPRNVEAEGIEIHPEYRPAARPPGERPPVTAAGIRNAAPMWLAAGSGEPREPEVRDRAERAAQRRRLARGRKPARIQRGLLLDDGVVPHEARQRRAAQNAARRR